MAQSASVVQGGGGSGGSDGSDDGGGGGDAAEAEHAPAGGPTKHRTVAQTELAEAHAQKAAAPLMLPQQQSDGVHTAGRGGSDTLGGGGGKTAGGGEGDGEGWLEGTEEGIADIDGAAAVDAVA